MFGMGFTELLVIAVIAILFLGPDKLPSTMVEIAKFFRNMKQTVNSVKESINEEIHLEDIKKEAMEYKQKLLEAETKIQSTMSTAHLNEEINALIEDETPPQRSDKPIKPAYEQPTFTKRKAQESPNPLEQNAPEETAPKTDAAQEAAKEETQNKEIKNA